MGVPRWFKIGFGAEAVWPSAGFFVIHSGCFVGEVMNQPLSDRCGDCVWWYEGPLLCEGALTIQNQRQWDCIVLSVKRPYLWAILVRLPSKRTAFTYSVARSAKTSGRNFGPRKRNGATTNSPKRDAIHFSKNNAELRLHFFVLSISCRRLSFSRAWI